MHDCRPAQYLHCFIHMYTWLHPEYIHGCIYNVDMAACHNLCMPASHILQLTLYMPATDGPGKVDEVRALFPPSAA